LRKIFSFCSSLSECEENVPTLINECWKYRCMKVFFWSSTINVTTVTIFLEVPRRAHLLWKEGLGIALGSCQGTERKNADSKKRFNKKKGSSIFFYFLFLIFFILLSSIRLKKRSNWDENKYYRIIKSQILRRYILSKIHPSKWLFNTSERSKHRIPTVDGACPNCFRKFIEPDCSFCDSLLVIEFQNSINEGKLSQLLHLYIQDDDSCKISVMDLEFDLDDDY